jgi:hypothetical protein
MNTYNDNLRNSVVSLLNAQELQLIQKKAQWNSALSILSYAEEALLMSGTIAEEALAKYEHNLVVEKQAINIRDISNSLLTTAQHENTNLDQSVTNVAVAAANVQIAANGILRLASDAGSVYSIIHAADYGKDIYEQAEKANGLMIDTAYLAEKISLDSMEASQKTAEVSGVAVLNSATATNNAVTNLYEIAAADLKNSEELLSTSNENYATASAAEKVAECNLENANVGYIASESTYDLSNEELNLALSVKQTSDSPLEYTVSFNSYNSPFPPSDEVEGYPVKDYYIIVVKNKSKSSFSMASAENLVLRQDQEPPWVKKVPSDSTDSNTVVLNQEDLYDSDGEELKPGEEYVVFVLAVFLNSYKKELNNYDDYLTAPSLSFKLTYHLYEKNNSSNLGSSIPFEYVGTEAKKAELDKLVNEVILAQGEVEQMQAIVTALTEKATNFQNFLNVATSNKEQALNNKNFVDDVVQNALELMKESKVAYDQMKDADESTRDVTNQITIVINKLIYSAEVINKFANTVIKEKASNPLISDELISMINNAGTDANNAVALCLTALQSSFVAQASNGESEASAILEYQESIKLHEVLTKDPEDIDQKKEQEKFVTSAGTSISTLLTATSDLSVVLYEDATIANNDTIEELLVAKANLNTAQINLQSLQAGLAAANAAALAS